MEHKIKKLGIMLDCSRDGVYTVKTLKTYMDWMQKMGYNSLQLYTEDTYSLDDPYFGYLRGRYSRQELRELDIYARDRGIELVPCIQTLAHLAGFLRWKPELVDCNDILLTDSDATYELIDKMFAACADCFTSRRINIGMDEAHMVGLGKYLDLHGYENRFDILRRHLARVVEIAEKYGFQPMMWSDMFFRLAHNGEYDCQEGEVMPQEIIDLVPENLQLIYWDYYSVQKSRYDKMIAAHQQFRNPILFASGAWSWSGFVPHNDFSIAANEASLRSCLEYGVEEVIITNWKDDGAECSLFATLPSMFFAARMVQGQLDRKVLEQEFRETFGISYGVFQAVEAAELSEGLGYTNPNKYMLYSDPFVGFMDWTVDPEKCEKFQLAIRALQQAEPWEYGYITDTWTCLMQVMEKKYALGWRLRKAYRGNDRQALSDLARECDELSRNVKAFYEAFRRQWMAECKPYGFEKHSVRLGGLSLRLEECGRRIREYLAGGQPLSELEEEILPVAKDVPAGKAICCIPWINVSAVKPLM